MIFVGDVSLSGLKKRTITDPHNVIKGDVVYNLEGALVNDITPYLDYKLVVNDLTAVKSYFKDPIFNLANNHILDNNDINETITNLNLLGTPFFGAGRNKLEASFPYIGGDIILLSFGWSVIECESATNNSSGVNPLKDEYVKNQLLKYKSLYKEKVILILMHWDYELELYPMPSQRKLAHDLINLGCDGIIGAHPHRVQGSEVYRGKPIIYSLGNWLFDEGIFCKGKLKFPNFCQLQLAFEFKLNGNHICHFFQNNPQTGDVKFYKSEPLESSKILKDLSPFRSMNHLEYDFWFKKNRYHKKLIPVYYSSSSSVTNYLKSYFNFFRTKAINFLVRVGLK